MMLLICIVDEACNCFRVDQAQTKKLAAKSFKYYYNLFVDKILLQYQKIYHLTKWGRLQVYNLK